MSQITHGVIISSLTSSAGKTTASLLLAKTAINEKYSVQMMKCGPDFIDPILHQQINTIPSINLDSLMMSASHIRHLYQKYAADFNIIEGMMGLYDSADNAFSGSTAAIAKILDLPIVLVVNANQQAQTLQAILFGMKSFMPELQFAGIIFNHCPQGKYFNYLSDLVTEIGFSVLGRLSKVEQEMSSQHLGLNPYQNGTDYLKQFESDNRMFLDWDILCDKCRHYIDKDSIIERRQSKDFHVTVCQDSAFSFIYHENLELLNDLAEITFISPLKNESIPPCDLVYLPGGFQEFFFSELILQEKFIESLKRHIERKDPLIAECGGMFILSDSITFLSQKHRGLSIIPTEIDFQSAGTISYVTITGQNEFSFLSMMAQEFHLSNFQLKRFESSQNIKAIRLKTSDEISIFFENNIWASYLHLYWAEKPSFLKKIMNLNRSK